MAKALSDDEAKALMYDGATGDERDNEDKEEMAREGKEAAILSQEVLRPTTLAGFKIESLADQEPFINGLLIYGQSKAGKTRLACSAGDVPEMCPVLLIDANEKGTLSVRRQKNVDLIKATTEGDLIKLATELRRKPGVYRTVILDSLSEVQSQILAEIMFKAVNNPKNNLEDPEVPSPREWGILLVRLIKLVKMFRDIPETHIIFTAGATISVNNEERVKPKVITPDLNGQAAFKVPMRMDEVFYLHIKEHPTRKVQQRLLQTSHTEAVLAGSRSGELPEVMVDPTMSKLFPLLIEKAKDTK
jgi:hypothetical protein